LVRLANSPELPGDANHIAGAVPNYKNIGFLPFLY